LYSIAKKIIFIFITSKGAGMFHYKRALWLTTAQIHISVLPCMCYKFIQ